VSKPDINESDGPTFSNQQSDQIDEPISEQAVNRATRDGTQITLDPDVAAVFRDAASVNRVLRALIDTMPLTPISATVPVRIYPTHGFDQLDQRISATVDGQLLPTR
jgi:hypothetical protein